MKNHFSEEQKKNYIIQLVFDNLSKIDEGSLTLVFQDACLIQINKKEITQVNEDLLLEEEGVIA
ncbi:DUF2292 domain-containing protein [Clostridium aminobutyricum]|uniref:DUF2292 domain-containing protein n=1 Tax=Clostridium aminobutyricum TaxID=33953 RepID=A0A939IGP5_CLOAM|nr:DUF2292 domain-containing protein [Clostridium aminobutyricum]MBN7772242.1 DUF2292 domain-containing protein [Clostridium aminobutyricum]